MTIALWIVSGLLALAFLGAGLGKLATPREKLAPRMPYVEDFSPATIKLIGAFEVLGALGLILPVALDIAPVLTPIAAFGLVIIMIGAIATHIRRKELFVPNIVLGALALFVAVGRLLAG